MVVVGFNLLQSLDIENIPGAAAQAIQLLCFHEIFIFDQFLDEPQVAAYSPYIGVEFELSVHFEHGIIVGSDADVNKEGVLGFEFLTESVEEPIVGVELPCFLVLYAEEQVDVFHLAAYSAVFVERLSQGLPIDLIINECIRIHL